MTTFSLCDQLIRAARLFPRQEALCCGGQRLSWPQLLTRTRRMAGVLRQLQVGPGDRVAILALNSADYYALYFAAPWIGAIVVPVNIRLAPAEIVYWLNDSGARVLLVDQAFQDTVAGIRRDCPSIEHYLSVDSESPAGTGNTDSWLELLGPLLADAQPVADDARTEREVAALFYTGGTTGRSRGVMLTHTSMLHNILQWIIVVGTSRADTLLIAAPMFHMVAGLNSIAAAVLGARLVIQPRFDPGEVLSCIESERITKAALVPAMVEMLVSHPDFPRRDVSSLQRISYGGAPMPEEIMEKAQANLTQVQFYQIYGQTEASGIVSCLGPEYHTLEAPRAAKRRSAGQPAPGTDLAILDEQGGLLPSGEIGEIVVRSPGLSRGYWQNEEETHKLFRQGWLHTGDAGYLDADGFLYIVDRLKDMIVTGGENVYAAEVENVLYRLPGVKQCAVIGIPSDTWGEQVHAVIRLVDDSGLDENDVIAFCREHLANYKCVRSVEFRAEDLPVSAMNKILKRELRRPWWESQARRI
ncbi:MAG: long-chain-fatty-acid--CoA ligase [Haliea sp.]